MERLSRVFCRTFEFLQNVCSCIKSRFKLSADSSEETDGQCGINAGNHHTYA